MNYAFACNFLNRLFNDFPGLILALILVISLFLKETSFYSLCLFPVYSPSFYGTSEPSLSSVKALGIVKQNKAYFTKIVYTVLFSIILCFLFKH